MTLGTKGLTFPTNFTGKIKKTNPKASPSVISCSLTDEQGRIVLLLPQAMLFKICILVGCFALSYGSEPEALVPFIQDIIRNWQLLSPTIIAVDDLPTICMEHQWLLCLSDNEKQGTNELANHLASIHQPRSSLLSRC